MFKIFALTLFLFGSIGAASVAAQHEYAPIEEKTFNYNDWTFKNITDGSTVNLREFARGKKLVMVVYFAPWCPNWKNEAPVALSLYQKYHKLGLEIIGISEYASVDDAKAYFGADGPPYTVVSESDSRESKQSTTHYTYRKATGDGRNWGSPWNIFLIPTQLNPRGELLTEKAFIVNGELIEADADKFIREHLGLEPGKTADVTLPGPATPCEPAKPTATFKKP